MNKTTIPFNFVLEQLSTIPLVTHPMFGCYAIYLGNKLVLMLRDRKDFPNEYGVWIANTLEHRESLKKDFPSMRSFTLFRETPSGWQNLPLENDDFEEFAVKTCRFILKGDPRIGKVPKLRGKKISKKRVRKINLH